MHLKDSLLIFFLAQIHNRGSKSENQTIRRYGIVFRIVFLLKRIRRSDEIECSESSSFRPAYRLSLKLLFPILHSPLGATEPQRNKGQRRDRGIPFEGVRSRSRSPEESFGRIQTEYLLKKNQTKARKLPNRWGMKSRPFRLRKRPKVKGERTKESGPVCLEWERSRVWACLSSQVPRWKVNIWNEYGYETETSRLTLSSLLIRVFPEPALSTDSKVWVCLLPLPLRGSISSSLSADPTEQLKNSCLKQILWDHLILENLAISRFLHFLSY